MLSLDQLSAQDRLAVACKLDPVVFSRQAGVTPDPWQARLLRSRAPRILLLASRQAGKSTTVATLAAHEALYKPGSLTLCVAPSQRQSGELFRKVLDVYASAGRHEADPLAESKLSLELDNGSRIVALPGKEGTIRGYSGVSLLLLDEAARIPDELLAAVRPMLAVSQGRQVALTSPWGKRGWVYDAWVSDEPYERYKVPCWDIPRIPRDFLDEEKRVLGPLIFASEYECEFVDPAGSTFRSDEVERAFKDYQTWNLDDYLPKW